MAKKKAAAGSAKRLTKLESPSEIVADFVAGMKADKEVKDSIQLLGDSGFRQRIKGVISTRTPTLDAAIGRGGFPLSRISILHGKEGCLCENTMVVIERGMLSWRRQIPLSGLFKMFRESPALPIRILSMRTDGTQGFTPVLDVIDNGMKPLFRVTVEGGREILATANHPVWVRRYASRVWKWLPVEVLAKGDSVMVDSQSSAGFIAARVESVSDKPTEPRQVYDVTVSEEGGFRQAFCANDVVVHNSGKTTLALQLCAETQSRGGLVMYIDKEHKLDPDYAESIGVDLSRMIMSAPSTLEGVVNQIKATVRRASEINRKTKHPTPFLIVVDSLNACKAFETIETPTGTRRFPAEARIWSEELPGLCESLANEHVGLVFVSQVRKKMNVMFGNDEEMAGGNAPRFYASLVVYVTRTGTEKEGKGGEKVASICEAECRKNQIAPPFKKAKFSIYWNRGVDYEGSLVLQLEKLGLVKKREGGYLRIGKVDLGQGYPAAANMIRNNQKLRAKLVSLFHQRMGWDAEG